MFKIILKAKNEEKNKKRIDKNMQKKCKSPKLLHKIKFWPKKGYFCTLKARPKETKPPFHLNL